MSQVLKTLRCFLYDLFELPVVSKMATTTTTTTTKSTYRPEEERIIPKWFLYSNCLPFICAHRKCNVGVFERFMASQWPNNPAFPEAPFDLIAGKGAR